VWETIEDDLPPLKAAVPRALLPPSAKPKIALMGVMLQEKDFPNALIAPG
jgi:hypothetical protein